LDPFWTSSARSKLITLSALLPAVAAAVSYSLLSLLLLLPSLLLFCPSLLLFLLLLFQPGDAARLSVVYLLAVPAATAAAAAAASVFSFFYPRGTLTYFRVLFSPVLVTIPLLALLHKSLAFD
jgi:hypothetical protein